MILDRTPKPHHYVKKPRTGKGKEKHPLFWSALVMLAISFVLFFILKYEAGSDLLIPQLIIGLFGIISFICILASLTMTPKPIITKNYKESSRG